MKKKTYKITHNVNIVDRASYQDNAKYNGRIMTIEAYSERAAIDICINKLQDQFILSAEEQE